MQPASTVVAIIRQQFRRTGYKMFSVRAHEVRETGAGNLKTVRMRHTAGNATAVPGERQNQNRVPVQGGELKSSGAQAARPRCVKNRKPMDLLRSALVARRAGAHERDW